MEALNFFLQVTNGSIAILTFFLLIFLCIYLHYDIKREGFSFKSFFIMSTAASLVVALFIEKIGTIATRTIVWVWRANGGTASFTYAQNLFLVLGAIFTALGLILLIRVLSRPRFGNWPWMVSTIVTLDYATVEIFIRMMK